MDLLAQRYASPFLILDEFARLKQLHEFVVETLIRIANEKVHSVRWDYWLHKILDITFEDFVCLCEEQKAEDKELDCSEIGSIISDSKTLLNGFVPE